MLLNYVMELVDLVLLTHLLPMEQLAMTNLVCFLAIQFVLMYFRSLH